MKSRSEIKRVAIMKKKPWGTCHECQLKAGGEIPEGGHRGITVCSGYCLSCGKDTVLVPDCDYDWPKKGIKAVWD